MTEPTSAEEALGMYKDARELAKLPLRVLIQAAILTEDEDSHRLEKAYPLLWAETMQRRFNSADGSLPGDNQLAEQEPAIEALDRE